jgi:hypothetical protein
MPPAPAAAQQEFRRSDFQERVVEEEADGLRLLIGVGGPSAFVAAFCNRAEIILADVFRAALVPAMLSFARAMSP